MVNEVVLRAEQIPVAFGPARQLIDLLGIADSGSIPDRVAATVLHRFDHGGGRKIASLTDAASVEGQIRYQLMERIDRAFAAFADLLNQHIQRPTTIRLSGSQYLDEGTRRLFNWMSGMCEKVTISFEPGRPHGSRRVLTADENRILAILASDTMSDGDIRWLIDRAQIYLHVGDAWTATALLAPVAGDHSCPEIHQVMAIGNVILGHPEKAERHYEAWAATGTPVDAARARYGQAMLYARHHPPHLCDDVKAATLLDRALGDLDEAEPSLKEEVEFDRIFNRNGYALLQFRAGRVEEATAFIEEALATLSTTSERNRLHRSVLMYNRAQVLRRTGNEVAAIDEYLALLDVDPNMPEYHMELALCYMEIGAWEEAARQLDHARSLDPYIPEGHSLRAQIAEHMGETSQAIEFHREAFRVAPGRIDLAYSCAYALSEAGDWAAVISLLGDVEPYELPGDIRAEVSSVLAEALVNLDRVDEAIELLVNAVELTPGDEDLRDNLATVKQVAHTHA